MKKNRLNQVFFVIFCSLLLVSAALAQDTGSGTLTVDNQNCDPAATGDKGYESPHHWDVLRGLIVHINISAGFGICTTGDPNKINDNCDDNQGNPVDDNCDSNVGQCETNNACDKLSHCTTGSVGSTCTTNNSCNITGVCTADVAGTCTAGTNIGNSCTTNANCSYVAPSGTCVGTGSNKTCNAGPRLGLSCSNDGQCSVAGTCTIPKHCTNSGATSGNLCTANNDCNVAGTCTLDATGICQDELFPKVCSTSNDCNTCSDNADANANLFCVNDDSCRIQGTCEDVLECSGDTNVVISGHAGECSQDSDCASNDCDIQTCTNFACSLTGLACTTDANCPGLCTFQDTVSTNPPGRTGNGDIDVCYNTREDMCLDAEITYCDGFEVNVNNPPNSQVFQKIDLEPVADTDGDACTDTNTCDAGTCSVTGNSCTDSTDCPDAACMTDESPSAFCKGDNTCQSPITVCSEPTSTCTNEVGSICCGLTQGAYGAPNSVATASVTGFLPAAAGLGCDAFAGDPNATTIGIHNLLSVTNDNLGTLIDYLPASGTSKYFNYKCPGCVGPDTHFNTTDGSSTNDIPDPSGSGSKGQGGGTLSGQTMAGQLNLYLSACVPPFGGGFATYTPSGFGDFEIPDDGALICTKRSGPDKVLGNGDDVCQAFLYPTCVWGCTVEEILNAANTQLATGTNTLACNGGATCAPADLTNALNNINVEFDQCGEVIACDGVATAGVFTCP